MGASGHGGPRNPDLAPQHPSHGVLDPILAPMGPHIADVPADHPCDVVEIDCHKELVSKSLTRTTKERTCRKAGPTPSSERPDNHIWTHAGHLRAG